MVANLVGRSDEWLRLVESGRQRLDSVQVMSRLAEVLRIDDFNQLIERPVREVRGSTAAARPMTELLEQAIVDHPKFHAAGALTEKGESLTAIRDELSQCQHAWTTSPRRYSTLVERIPSILAEARARKLRLAGLETDQLLVRAYHLARQLLTRFGEHGLAWTVADRAMEIAASTHSPGLVAASACHVTNALLHLEQIDQCRSYARSAATHLLDEVVDPGDRAVLSGTLALLAAKGAAATLDLLEADRLIGQAQREAAELASEHQVFGIDFGPFQIALARMEIALGHASFDDVVRIGSDAEVVEGYPVGGRARYHIALAIAFARRDEDVAAAFALAKAAEACPEDLRFDPDAHHTVLHLIRRDNRLISRDVTRLANLAGLG
ncbi:hypothetical protein BOX37_17060 [Nocardia mangyaensis]|uniref:Uncharacterized protein n=1 Tax=Nocardia mangyaensis TaxID=2213200 RepID=A0A1J0VTJ7_9NOCA|nr:hypothetical protein BOX37_17060 [Nocardia mangyaensis]